jgi:hypothetical protein
LVALLPSADLYVPDPSNQENPFALVQVALTQICGKPHKVGKNGVLIYSGVVKKFLCARNGLFWNFYFANMSGIGEV